MITRADVTTDRPERYAKQLVSHLSRKCSTEEVLNGTRLRIAPPERAEGFGTVLVVRENPESPGKLTLIAEADDREGLELVQHVLGGHLVRFGEKDGLEVNWEPAD